MNRKKIDYTEYANVITKALEKGIFLTSKAEGKENCMVIGWAHIGRNWEKGIDFPMVTSIPFRQSDIIGGAFSTIVVLHICV